MTAIVFTVPGKPVPKQRARKGPNGWYTPTETRRYERAVGFHATRARQVHTATGGEWPMGRRYEVEVLCVWADRRRRDIDNVLKSVLDGLNGVLFADDSQVVRAIVSRSEPERATRTVVRVRVLEPGE
jgi:Holliday junction resolvase RusA-like endonuclease